MFHDDEFDRIFKQMSGSFMNLDNVFEMLKNAGNISGPVFYGYTMTTGPDGKPVVQEYGNVQPDRLPLFSTRVGREIYKKNITLQKILGCQFQLQNILRPKRSIWLVLILQVLIWVQIRNFLFTKSLLKKEF